MTTKRLLSFVMALAMVMSLVVFPAYATTEPLVGDVNGDGAVTTDDVVDLLLFITMPDMYPLEGHLDFVSDGAINTDDAVQLLLHISMPDRFPLETAPEETEPEATTLVLGDNAVALEAGSETGETWTYTAEFTGKLELTISSLKYDFEGTGEFYEASQMDLEMGFGRMYAFNINGENVGVYTTSLDVTEGDVVTVGLLSYSGFATEAVITLAQGAEQGGDEPIVSTQDIVLAAGDLDGETISYVAQSTGKLNIAVTALKYDWEGLGNYEVADAMTLEMGFGRMYCLTVDGVQYYQSSVEIDVEAYQLVEVNLMSAYGYATEATVTFTETAGTGGEATDPTVPGGDEGTQDNPFVIDALPYSIPFFGGMDQYYTYTTTEAGNIVVSYLEGGILSLPNGEAWDQDENMNYIIPVEADYELVLNPWTMQPELSGEMVVSFVAAGGEVTDPTDPSDPSDPSVPTIPELVYLTQGDNLVGLNSMDQDGETWTYNALNDGTLTITVSALKYDWEGTGVFTEVSGMDLEMGFARMYRLTVDGAQVFATTVTIDVVAGQQVEVSLISNYGYATIATLTLTEGEGGEATDPTVPGEPDGSQSNPFVIDALPYSIPFFGGMDQYYTYTATEAGNVVVSYLEGGILSLPNGEYWEQDENNNYVIAVEAGYELVLNPWTMQPALSGEMVVSFVAAGGTEPTEPSTEPTEPSTEPTTPSESEPTTPSESEPTTPAVGYVTTPVVGQAYKFMLTQANLGKDLYITGAMDGYYYATTEDAAAAVTVYFEEAEGGYRVYFLNDGVKTYMEIVANGNYTNVVFTTSPTKVLKWNADIASVTCDVNGTEYYFGTYNTYKTFSASKISYVTGDNAASLDVSNFVGHFYVTEGEAPVDPTVPSESEPTTPSESESTAPSESEPAAEAGYVKITSADQLVSGQYVMIVGTGYAPGLFDNGWLTAVQPVVDGDKVTDTQGAVWTLTIGADGVSIQDSDGMFVAPKGGNNNGIINAEYFWAVSFENGAFRFAGTGSDTVILASNVGSENKFRGYKTTTVAGNANGYPCDFTLYALVEGETPVDPTEPSETEPTVPSETEPVVLPQTPAEIVAAAWGLAPGESLEGTYTLTGVISAINTPYSTQYSNVTVTIVVEGMEEFPIQCYRLAGTGADQIGKGDTITVTGSLTNYNGNIQFAQGCTLDAWEDTGAEEILPTTPEEIVNAAYALAVGEAMSGTYTLTGVITEIDTAYSEQYSNVTVTIVVGDMTDKPIMCYRLKGEGADQIAVGDTITVTGAIKNFYGTVEFDSGCTLDAWEAGEEESKLLTWQEYVKLSGTEQRTYKESFENSADYYAWLAEAQAAYDAEHESVMDGVINMGDLVDNG